MPSEAWLPADHMGLQLLLRKIYSGSIMKDSFFLTFRLFLTFSRQYGKNRWIGCGVTNLIQDACREDVFLTKKEKKREKEI